MDVIKQIILSIPVETNLFAIEDKVFGINKFMGIAIEKSTISTNEEATERHIDFAKIFDETNFYGKRIFVRLIDLENAYTKIPDIQIEEYDKCNVCNGKKRVEFQFEHNNEIYYTDDCCPICNGTGHATKEPKIIRKAKDSTYYVNIADYLFLSEPLRYIIELMRALNVYQTSIAVSRSNFTCRDVDYMIFSIGLNVQVLVSTCTLKDNENKKMPYITVLNQEIK